MLMLNHSDFVLWSCNTLLEWSISWYICVEIYTKKLFFVYLLVSSFKSNTVILTAIHCQVWWPKLHSFVGPLPCRAMHCQVWWPFKPYSFITIYIKQQKSILVPCSVQQRIAMCEDQRSIVLWVPCSVQQHIAMCEDQSSIVLLVPSSVQQHIAMCEDQSSIVLLVPYYVQQRIVFICIYCV